MHLDGILDGAQVSRDPLFALMAATTSDGASSVEGAAIPYYRWSPSPAISHRLLCACI